MERKKKNYSSPVTQKTTVSCEGYFCSSDPIKKLDATIEVDDWVTVENDVTFN